MAGIAIGAVVDAATYSTRLDAGLKSKKTQQERNLLLQILAG